HLLRKAARRNPDAICDAIASILDTVTPPQCRNFFAQAGYDLKHLLRKAARRNPDAICDAIASILDTVTPPQCRNFFAQAGYDLR
ncbi:hypothetical protein BWR60_35855, partial [Inquilinus limosus]